jgi:hypothetical protein
VTAAVEAAGEFCRVIADGYKSCVGVPQPRSGFQLAHVDVIRQRVTGIRVDCHQLQLVRVGDSGRVFGPQERAGITVADPPGVIEVERGIACLGIRGVAHIHHVRRRAVSSSNRNVTPGGVGIPVAIADAPTKV